ncbi:MAG: UpxY family transcription antiterminator [Terriglobales bacterium]
MTERAKLYQEAGNSVEEVAAGKQWYAVQTRSRHEKMVARQLRRRGITTFLPLISQLRKWSDRQKLVESPLFPGYAFVQLAYEPKARLGVLSTDGVVNFVGAQGHGNPIPDEQITSVQNVLGNKIPCESHPYLKVGQRVRIRGGSLEGTQGILVGTRGDHRLVISVELIQQSVAIQVGGHNVVPA